MNSDPTVSVVVAAYHSDRYLKLALNDAIRQTWTDLEIVVSDDADSRETRELVAKLNDPRIRYLANRKRLGSACNHRAALQAAKGRFVAILNHDDRWDPDYLARLLPPLLSNDRLKFAFCDHRVIDSCDHDLPARADLLSASYGRSRLQEGRQVCLAPLFISQTVPTDIAAVFRRNALDPCDLPDHAGPAYDLWLGYLLTRTDGEAYYVPERLTAWREHPENLTSQGGLDWCTGTLTCWQQAARDPAFAPWWPEIRGKLAATLQRRAAIYLQAGESTAARRDAFQSLRLKVFSPKATAIILLSLLPKFMRSVANASADKVVRKAKR